MNLEEYLTQRINDISQALKVLPNDKFLKGELLAYKSILKKLEENEK